MSGQYRLVRPRVGDNHNPLDAVVSLTGVYYHKGRIVIAMPIDWFLRLFYAYIAFNMILAIWITCFPNTPIIHALWWMTCPVATYYTLRVILYIRRRYNKRFQPIPFYKLPFFLPCILAVFAVGIAQNRIFIFQNAEKLMQLEVWVSGLQYTVDHLADEMVALDKRFETWTKSADERYTKALNEKASMQKMEALASNMWKGFGLITVTRQHFGLGCFVNGTLLQLNADGTVVKKIEDLNETDLVFNPDLNESVKIRVLTAGPEDGYIYEIVTKDSLSVSVTKTHPMKICQKHKNDDNEYVMMCENVAASNVYPGNMTQTVHGFQEIVSVKKMAANNVMVYNVMLDIDGAEAITHRTLIANGIHTFDFYAQALNE